MLPFSNLNSAHALAKALINVSNTLDISSNSLWVNDPRMADSALHSKTVHSIPIDHFA
jgi:hypothetical protein